MDFEDQVVVITGAPGGLGTGVTRAFAERGARLALANRSSEPLAKFEDLDRALLVGETDVTDPASVEAMVKRVMERWGRIDVLVNVAGTWSGGDPVHETDLKTFDGLMALNARSILVTARAIVPIMIDQGSGKIVSVAAESGLKAGRTNGAYSASKAAVIRLTESMAADLKHKGINVNCVLPTIIDTPSNREMMSDADFETWVTPASLADVILFLASERARDIHGVALPVAGRV